MAYASLKRQGPWEVRRKFKVPAMARTTDARVVEQALVDMAGVRGFSVDVAKSSLSVRYETTETDYQKIRNALTAAGFPSADGWWARRKAVLFQNLDLTGRENATVKPSACCNKPPVVRR